MKDASNTRRSLGKLGILAAGAIILPLTATIVPAVVAQEAETVASEDTKPEITKKNVKVIRIHGGDKNVHVISHDGEGKEVTKVERDGKTFVFHTDKKLSEDEVEKMVAEAKKSAEEAHKMAEEHRGTAMSMKVHADEMEEAHKRITVMHKNIGDAQSFSWDDKEFRKAMNIAAYIPEIDIREITKNCKEGQPVTTDVSGFDGKGKSRVKLVMCGKGQAKIARASALEGLREAKDDVAGDEDIPESIRKDVVEKLEEQIRKLEAQADKAG